MPPVVTQTGMFTYLLLMGTLYFSSYTVYSIPYAALGFELTSDYDERTRLLAWPNYVGLLGSITMPWLYSIALLPLFGNEVVGARWVSVVLALLIIAFGTAPAIFLREPARAQHQEKIKLLDAVKVTLGNRPYLVVLCVNVIVLLGLATMLSLGLYINIYYIYGGDKAAAAKLSGIAGSLTAVLSYASVYLATFLSTRFGKRRAVETGLGLSLIGVVSMWWTLDPARPYLQLISAAFVGLGLQGCWMLFISMIGDVCEEDELATGLRREGIYSAVGGFSRKLAVAVAALGGGVLLKVCGYDATVAETSGAPAEVVERMKLLFILGQIAVLVLGIVLLHFYPITRERAMETQRLLRERREKAAAGSGN
jgi:GPH family glycoside/pentoside/hexuronide:cation symporter